MIGKSLVKELLSADFREFMVYWRESKDPTRIVIPWGVDRIDMLAHLLMSGLVESFQIHGISLKAGDCSSLIEFYWRKE